jgi:hypothetical protein
MHSGWHMKSSLHISIHIYVSGAPPPLICKEIFELTGAHAPLSPEPERGPKVATAARNICVGFADVMRASGVNLAHMSCKFGKCYAQKFATYVGLILYDIRE